MSESGVPDLATMIRQCSSARCQGTAAQVQAVWRLQAERQCSQLPPTAGDSLQRQGGSGHQLLHMLHCSLACATHKHIVLHQ